MHSFNTRHDLVARLPFSNGGRTFAHGAIATIFSMLFAASALVAEPRIVDMQISPATARDGQTVTLRYQIQSSTSRNAVLGAAIRSPEGVVADDPTNEHLIDNQITIQSGTRWYERDFFINLPPGAGTGNYRVTWEVHWGSNGFTSESRNNALSISSSVPVDVPVLMYHKVGDTAHSRFWVTDEQLEEHIRALLEYGYTPVTLQDVANYRAGIDTAPQKPVVITFDDGYRDLVTHVLPVISKSDLRVPITAFVNPGLVGQNNRWDSNIDFNNEPEVRHATWNQLQTLHNSGLVDIQSHTVNHANLLTTSSTEERFRELEDARLEIENRLNKPVRFFAYPWGGGAHHEDVHRDVHRAGYFMALGIDNVEETRTRQKWALHRHEIHSGVTADPNTSQPENFLFGSSLLNDPDAYPGGFVPHPADSDSNREITLQEVIAYGNAWRSGSSWDRGPNPPTLPYVINAGTIWRGGGSYTYNSSGSGASAWNPQ